MTQRIPTFVPGFHDPDVVSRIPYQRLGQTDMLVSRLSFGCSSISHGVRFSPDGQVLPDDQQVAKNIHTIHSAVKAGINYFDTSPFYGAGKSEIVLGKALSGLPRSSFYVATKVGRNERCQFNYSRPEVRRLVQRSLTKLQVTYIDLVQVHDVEFAASVDVVVKETLPALEELRKEGLIKYIGITGYPLDVLKRVIQANDPTSVRIDTILSYCRHTLFNNDLLEYVQFFRDQNLGIINAAVHGMGLLTGTELPDWHPATEAVRSACRAAIQLCSGEADDICNLTTAHALASCHVDTVLTGMTTTEILQANLNVLSNGVSEGETRVLERIQRECMCIPSSDWEGIELRRYHCDKEEFCNMLRKLHGDA